MKKFEYLTVYSAYLMVEHTQQLDFIKLNSYGDAGWELVTVAGGQCIFKREVSA